MTKEQIAELREILRVEFMPVWGTTDGRVVTWKTTPDVSKLVALALNALPRLLDEREALLEALRHVEWGGDSFQGFAAVCPDCVAHEGKPHEPDCVLAAALARAELP